MSPFSFRHKYKNVRVKMGDKKMWEKAQNITWNGNRKKSSF